MPAGGQSVRWLELSATIVNDLDGAADLLGLISDITARKEEEARKAALPPTDPLTGLGNRVALMAALDGPPFPGRRCWRCSIWTASSPSMPAWAMPAAIWCCSGMAERLTERFGTEARIFRVGGDGFALLFARPALSAEALGEELVALCGPPHPYDGRGIFAPASAGIAPAAERSR